MGDQFSTYDRLDMSLNLRVVSDGKPTCGTRTEDPENPPVIHREIRRQHARIWGQLGLRRLAGFPESHHYFPRAAAISALFTVLSAWIFERNIVGSILKAPCLQVP